ncbi:MULTISPECIES: hypothetical protein [Psychrobacter]|uniref:hypothetical protein n=1 Tax=Psychrobacter TaxID=497 RepID=UPI000EBB6CA1|nr:MULTISPECIES: hypothetical protein [Psychrobacter]HCT72531.1 hypothetical protein [Psychrobacter sp.]
MKNISNWKFKKWVNWIENSPSDMPTDIWNYINLEIYPEDIEIISTILLPITFEYKGIILLNIEGIYEKEISEMYDKGLPNMASKVEAQESMNRLMVDDVFFNTADRSSNETIMNVAELIKHNWEYHLMKKYPNRHFIVEIVGESFYPVVTFYEP